MRSSRRRVPQPPPRANRRSPSRARYARTVLAAPPPHRPPRHAFDTFAPLFEADFGADQAAWRRADDVLRALATEAALREDPRWLDLATRLLSSSWVQPRALAALAASRSPTAARAIVAHLGELDLDEAGDALVALGDRTVAPALRAAAEGQRKPRAAKILRLAERLEALPSREPHLAST